MSTVVKTEWPDERVDELWSNVFGSAFEVWSWWSRVEFLDGADWDTPGRARLSIRDEYGRRKQKTIGVPDIIRALDACVTGGYRDVCTGKPIHETMDWDACSSDTLLQIAVLGEVKYG